MRRLVVLTPPPPRGTVPLAPPASLPLGRAALALAGDAIELVFVSAASPSGGLAGLVAADAASWREVEVEPASVAAVYDRFPSQRAPAAWAALREALAACVRWSNPPRAIALCRDKLAAQRALEARGVPMPELAEVLDDGAAEAALARWGAGFLKPRFGAFGAGVEQVHAGRAPLPREVVGLVAAQPEPALVQRAVMPPRALGCAGLSVRVLVQRGLESEPAAWLARTAVARVSTGDPVANVQRGAVALPLAELLASRAPAPLATRLAIDEVALEATRAVAAALDRDGDSDGAALLELGVDVVLDADWRPWVIEVNGKPAGHLGALARLDAARFAAAHAEACAQPLRVLSRSAARSPASPSTR